MTTATTTVLLGRKNYEGFSGYWPPVAHDETAEPRDRVFARWLNDVDKIVFSNTLEHAPWQNSRISNDPITEVRKLRNEPGGDIAVLSSTSIIQTLLTADELDRLIITLCPTIVGRGAPFFDDDVPETTWTLTETATSPTGATTLVYDRDS